MGHFGRNALSRDCSIASLHVPRVILVHNNNGVQGHHLLLINFRSGHHE